VRKLVRRVRDRCFDGTECKFSGPAVVISRGSTVAPHRSGDALARATRNPRDNLSPLVPRAALPAL
jgi:hypothetical protein